MKKPRLCYCPKGTTCYPSDECPNKPTTLENICVCGNRGYSALVNNEHFKDCPNYKPTTLREEIDHILRGIDKTETDHPEGWWETSTGAIFGAKKKEEIVSLLTSHNTELIRKIERMRNHKHLCESPEGQECEYEKALDEVINLINQEK